MYFDKDKILPGTYSYRDYGYAVRLVTDVK